MKKLILSLILFVPLALAQVTKVVPDCVIPVTFTAAGQTTGLTNCGTPNGAPNQNGISSWIFLYYSTSFSVVSVVVESAPDSSGAPGSWSTFGGTVLSSTQYPGSSGINPNTSTTSAFTGFAGYFPWMRVRAATLTGSGKLTGVLMGFYNSTLARGGGGGGSGTINTCATTALPYYIAATTLACDPNSLHSASVPFWLWGPGEGSLPSWITGNANGTALFTATTGTPLTIESSSGVGLSSNVINALTSYGAQIDSTTNATNGIAYGVAYTVQAGTGASTPITNLTLYGNFVQSSLNAHSATANLWHYYGVRPFLDASATLGNFVGFYHEDIGTLGITNPYYSWFDSRGVGRCRDDNTFNSVGQVICAVYNPQFTKYTPGAVDFERIIYGQFASNVAQMGAEAGGTGTLRDLQILGNRFLFRNLIVDASSNLSTPGSLTSGSGTGIAGILDLAQGTLPSIPANSWGWLAPTAMTTSQYYQHTNAVAAAHSVWIIGAPSGNVSTIIGKVIPDCQDSAGNHLNFTQSSDTFSCGNTSSGGGGATPTITIANAGSTGTTTSTLTKLTGAPSTAVIAATTDTGHVVGITTAGAGTAGNATIQIAGLVNCVFSNATTAGDYVQISSASAGNCADTGSATYPTSGQVIGRVLSTNGGAGTYQIDLFPPEMQGASGGGGAILHFQYYQVTNGTTGNSSGIVSTGGTSAGNTVTLPLGSSPTVATWGTFVTSGSDGIFATQLPTTWDGSNLTVIIDAIFGNSNSGTANFRGYSACVAAASNPQVPTWTAASATVGKAPSASGIQQWTLSIPVTGCVAGQFAWIDINRPSGDSYGSTIFMIGANIGIKY